MWLCLVERYKTLRIKAHTSDVPNSKLNKDWMITKCNIILWWKHPLAAPCGFKIETVKMPKISVKKLDLFYLRYLLDDNNNKIITYTVLTWKLDISVSWPDCDVCSCEHSYEQNVPQIAYHISCSRVSVSIQKRILNNAVSWPSRYPSTTQRWRRV